MKKLLSCYCEFMELFDIVNINDEVIGTMDRETAHKNRQLHRVAAVYVFNASGQLYVQLYKKMTVRNFNTATKLLTLLD